MIWLSAVDLLVQHPRPDAPTHRPPERGSGRTTCPHAAAAPARRAWAVQQAEHAEGLVSDTSAPDALGHRGPHPQRRATKKVFL